MSLKDINKIAYNQWHHEKNKHLDVDKISPNSHEIAYWQCNTNTNHAWASHIYARAESDISCPICINRRNQSDGPELLFVLKEYTSKRSFIANYWHCKDCKSIWKTESGDIIPTQITCSNCMFQKYAGEDSNEDYEKNFNEEYPEIAREWAEENILPATEVIWNCPLEIKWQCTKCHLNWSSFIEDRLYGKKSCPYCSKKLPIPGKTSLLALCPEIMEEWSNEYNRETNPDELFPDSRLTVGWKCKVCHILYPAKVYQKIRANTCICPNCNSADPIPSERYEFLKEEFYRCFGEISEFELMTPFYTATVEWKCNECNDIFLCSFKERFFEHKDCACVEGRKALPGKTSLKALYPDISKELSDSNMMDSDTILPSYSSPVVWDCSVCNMPWKGSIRERVEGVETGDNSVSCPYCAGKKAIPGKTSLKALYPDISKEFSGSNMMDSDTILPSYSSPVVWDCSVCNMPWKGSIRERVEGVETGDNSVSCPYCAGKKAIPGRTSFMVKQSELMNEWHIINWMFINPDHILENFNEKVWWICSTCHKAYSMSPKNRMYYKKRKQISCSYCKGLRRKKYHFI